MEIKTIIFDLGNVLIGFDHSQAAEKFSLYSPYKKEEIYQLIFDSDVVSRYEKGEIETKEFFRKLKELLKLKISYAQLQKFWNEIFFPHPQMEKLVRRLKGKYRLILLSNINSAHYNYVKRRFPILKEFDKIILSYRLGLRKPHPLLYQKAVEASHCLPEEILYIDDREDLILAARSLGINSVCFKNIKALKKTLKKFGVNSF
ncbi:MAG: HAD family phosphatase [Candidatus Omnitrophica bacterium]|nr:HAD family phosphatase [Candidatus Omnitrophota bacterium]